MATKKAKESTTRLSAKQFAHVAKVLAEPRRVEILKQMAANGGSISCGALATSHNITTQTMSHHTHELETSGLIEIVREGRHGTLHLQREILKAYLNELSEI